jgi:hypothetical protein
MAACLLLVGTTLPLPPARGQGQPNAAASKRPTGQIVRSHREAAGATNLRAQRAKSQPAWVRASLERSVAHLAAAASRYKLRAPEEELKLFAAEQDDLGQTHVRLAQVRGAAEVFAVHTDGCRAYNGGTRLTAEKFDAVYGWILNDNLFQP